MTDLVNGMNQSSDVSQAQPGIVESGEKGISQDSERFFSQSQLNEIVKKAKYGAVEDYKRLKSQQPVYAQEKHDESLSSPYLPPDKLSKMIEEATEKQIEKIREDAYLTHQRETAQRIVSNFQNKTQTGKEKFSDFDVVTGDIKDIMGNFPRVVELLADHVDNADEVYYEFGKDALKMAALQNLADVSMPAAIKEIKRFAKSLKDNEDAKRYRQPNEPLSQIRPSNNTGTDPGAMSVSDYRKKYRI
jgi:hypothetical protein